MLQESEFADALNTRTRLFFRETARIIGTSIPVIADTDEFEKLQLRFRRKSHSESRISVLKAADFYTAIFSRRTVFELVVPVQYLYSFAVSQQTIIPYQMLEAAGDYRPWRGRRKRKHDNRVSLIITYQEQATQATICGMNLEYPTICFKQFG